MVDQEAWAYIFSFFVFFVCFQKFTELSGEQKITALFGVLVFLVMGLCFLHSTIWHMRRKQEPILTLTPDYISFNDQDIVITWDRINDIYITPGGRRRTASLIIRYRDFEYSAFACQIRESLEDLAISENELRKIFENYRPISIPKGFWEKLFTGLDD
jgi:hypothetical protein